MLARALRRRLGKLSLMSELSVPQHARADGHRTPPLPHGEALSHTEASIIGRFNDRRGALAGKRDGALHTHRLGMIEASFPEHARSFPATVTAIKVAVHKNHLKFNLPSWQQALQHIVSCDAERTNFKKDNLLTRDADTPDPMLAIGIGALAFVIETAVNGLLFARVFEGGLAEGTLTAATLAAPNIGLGLIAGFWGLRACHDIRPAVRRLGAAVTGLSLSAAVAWNLYIGQIRALAEQRAAASQAFLPADWRAAAANLLTDPLAPFQSGPALSLVLLGVVVVAVALREGLDGFSDRVPGYSRVDRRYHQAVAHAETLKRRFFRDLDRLTRRGIRTINRRHRAVHAELHDAVGILGRAAGVIIRFDEHVADQFWVHREGLATYWAINRRARDEVDVPERFDQQPLCDAANTLPAFDWLAMRTRLQAGSRSACDAAQSAIAELQRYRLDIIEQVERQLAAVMRRQVLPAPLLLAAVKETV